MSNRINYKQIDKEFRPLIKELNKMGLITTQCCCGHDKRKAYLSISLKNIEDLVIRENGKRFSFWWDRVKYKKTQQVKRKKRMS